MATLKYVMEDGTVLKLAKGIKGDVGPTVYEAWLNEGNSGTVFDFLAEVWPELAPSATLEVTPTDTGSPYLVPTDHSLVTLSVPSPIEVGFADFVTQNFGTNPEGYSFTLHITSGLENVTWAIGVAVYGDVTGFSEAWATVIREGNSWKVLLGAMA